MAKCGQSLELTIFKIITWWLSQTSFVTVYFSIVTVHLLQLRFCASKLTRRELGLSHGRGYNNQVEHSWIMVDFRKRGEESLLVLGDWWINRFIVECQDKRSFNAVNDAVVDQLQVHVHSIAAYILHRTLSFSLLYQRDVPYPKQPWCDRQLLHRLRLLHFLRRNFVIASLTFNCIVSLLSALDRDIPKWLHL